MTLLEVQQLSHTFHHGHLPSTHTLHDISLKVQDGEITAIVGPSGCGKTTLLECIAGLLTPEEGTICVNGVTMRGACGHAAYMTQADVMLPWRNILDNVALPLEIAGQQKSAAQAQGLEFLRQFKLDQFAAHPPAALSGGMRQRAALLRAFIAQKRFLLLDEPFARLDALTRREIQNWFLQSWEERRPAVLFVTHDVDEALLLADRIIVLSARPGRITGTFVVNALRPRTPALTALPNLCQMKIEILELLGVN